MVSGKDIDWNRTLFTGQCLIVLLIGVTLVVGGRTTEGVLGVESIGGGGTFAIALVGVGLVLPYYDLGKLMTYWRRWTMREIREFLGVLGAGGLVLAAMGVVFWSANAVAEWLGCDSEAVARVLTVATVVCGGGVIGMRTLRNWAKWRRDRQRLAEVEVKGRWDREQVLRLLEEMGTARGRHAFVSMLDRGNAKPEGSWPGGRLPSYGDRASILLAELEERWLGLAR